MFCVFLFFCSFFIIFDQLGLSARFIMFLLKMGNVLMSYFVLGSSLMKVSLEPLCRLDRVCIEP